MIGQALLIVLALASAVGTYIADFDEHHVFNPSWTAHARFHSAAYAILNIGCALICVVLCLFTPLGRHSSLVMACALLFLMGLVLFLATAVKGTSPIAGPHEKILAGIPLALWINAGYLLVWALGSWLAF